MTTLDLIIATAPIPLGLCFAMLVATALLRPGQQRFPRADLAAIERTVAP